MHITLPTIIYLEFIIKTTKIEYIEFGVFLYRPTNLIYSVGIPVNKHEYLKTTKQSGKARFRTDSNHNNKK
jgi:hypothetical protein